MTDQDKTPPSAEGAESTDVPFAERRLCGARVSDELLIPDGSRRSERVSRHDGWTPDRIRIFITALSECGVVADAARAAGMSVRSAYYLRNRADGGAFNVAWKAALLRARQRLGDTVLSRALHGCVELVIRDGEVVGERHRFDNRLTMAVLNWLEKQAEAGDDESRAARFVAQEFDQFLDLVCEGGEGAAAFIASREMAETPFSPNDTARNLARLENYRRHGEGLAAETNVSEVAPDAAAGCTEERSATAEGCGLGCEEAQAECRKVPEDHEKEAPAGANGGAGGIVATWLRPSSAGGNADE